MVKYQDSELNIGFTEHKLLHNIQQLIQSRRGFRAAASFTRPEDTAVYAAGDAVGDTLVFTGAPAEGMIITGVTLRIDASALPSGMSGFKLHLYDAAPETIADNAAYNLPADDRDKYLGYIQLSAPADLGDTLWSQNDNMNFSGRLAGASLYGILTTDAAYTPASGTAYTVTLYAVGV